MNGAVRSQTGGAFLCPLFRLAPTRTRLLILAFLACLSGSAGCIERTISIRTEPEGATVILNDQEVGRSPVKVPFTWYGDYDLIIRKQGYKTIRTHQNVKTPWYALPGIDLITECMVPFTIHDDRVLDPFVLEPRTRPNKEELLEAADAMRAQALEGIEAGLARK